MTYDPGYYRLEGHEAVPEEDMLNWASWMEYANRRVAKTEVGPLTVSTVFLGLDHRFSGDGPPILFETMVFGGEPIVMASGRVSECNGINGQRYSTWAEAEAGHAEMVAWAEAKLAALDTMPAFLKVEKDG